eukprot:TRINITY_DN4107_c1_g2_i1.p1 TRINITY_DN4107_c1_g2~~TRINITY_DN4107_c1_g2_i1.p1  ORF type:complete len:396 (-),score=85.97 TRINITY_DN4107_c1_g2_i1:130-1317(-)
MISMNVKLALLFFVAIFGQGSQAARVSSQTLSEVDIKAGSNDTDTSLHAALKSETKLLPLVLPMLWTAMNAHQMLIDVKKALVDYKAGADYARNVTAQVDGLEKQLQERVKAAMTGSMSDEAQKIAEMVSVIIDDIKPPSCPKRTKEIGWTGEPGDCQPKVTSREKRIGRAKVKKGKKGPYKQKFVQMRRERREYFRFLRDVETAGDYVEFVNEMLKPKWSFKRVFDVIRRLKTMKNNLAYAYNVATMTKAVMHLDFGDVVSGMVEMAIEGVHGLIDAFDAGTLGDTFSQLAGLSANVAPVSKQVFEANQGLLYVEASTTLASWITSWYASGASHRGMKNGLQDMSDEDRIAFVRTFAALTREVESDASVNEKLAKWAKSRNDQIEERIEKNARR